MHDIVFNMYPALLALFLTIRGLSTSAQTLRNVTVDDTNPAITYEPEDQWFLSAASNLNVGGAHMLTSSPGATATFRFTGTAVYFMSPLWPYHVTTAVRLDDQNPRLLSLVDRNRPDAGGGPETMASAVVWSAINLTNTEHLLLVYIASGEPFAIVDAIVYTTSNRSDSTEVPSLATSTKTNTRLASPSNTQTASASGATAAAPVKSNSSPNTVAIALGVIFGVLGLAVILGILWLCCWKRRRDDSSDQRHLRNRRTTSEYAPASMATFSPQSLAADPRVRQHTYPRQSNLDAHNPSWISHPESFTPHGSMVGVGSGVPAGYPSHSDTYSPPSGSSMLWAPSSMLPGASDRGSARYQSTALSTITESSGSAYPNQHQSPLPRQSEIEYPRSM